MTTGTNNSVPLLVKGILVESVLSISTPVETETECFVHLIFNSTLQLTNGVSIDR